MNVFEQMSPSLQRQVAAADARADIEWRREQAEREGRAQDAADTAGWQAHLFEAEHGVSGAEYGMYQAEVREARAARDPNAEYGSEARPAFLLDGTIVAPPVRRSAAQQRDDLVEQYHLMGAQFYALAARSRQRAY